jgi:hypothetical protein
MIEGLPFGAYYITAPGRLPDDGVEAWRDPVLLESIISRTSPLTVRDGEKTTVTLQLPSDPRRPCCQKGMLTPRANRPASGAGACLERKVSRE